MTPKAFQTLWPKESGLSSMPDSMAADPAIAFDRSRWSTADFLGVLPLPLQTLVSKVPVRFQLEPGCL